jgi:hypothetical protein
MSMDSTIAPTREQLLAELFGCDEDGNEVACQWRPSAQRRERVEPDYAIMPNGDHIRKADVLEVAWRFHYRFYAPKEPLYRGGDIPEGFILRILPNQKRPRSLRPMALPRAS